MPFNSLMTEFFEGSDINDLPFFYKTSIFDPRPENCLSFSKKLPRKIVQQMFSRWSINFYYLNIQTF